MIIILFTMYVVYYFYFAHYNNKYKINVLFLFLYFRVMISTMCVKVSITDYTVYTPYTLHNIFRWINED